MYRRSYLLWSPVIAVFPVVAAGATRGWGKHRIFFPLFIIRCGIEHSWHIDTAAPFHCSHQHTTRASTPVRSTPSNARKQASAAGCGELPSDHAQHELRCRSLRKKNEKLCMYIMTHYVLLNSMTQYDIPVRINSTIVFSAERSRFAKPSATGITGDHS